MTDQGRELYRLILTPEGEGPPGIIRLRRALKGFLRAHGLRCVSAVEVKPSGSPPPENGPPGAAGRQDGPSGVPGTSGAAGSDPEAQGT